MRKCLIWPVLAGGVLAGGGGGVWGAPQAASSPATTQGTTQAAAFPDWAMKAYPDDIVRLMRFDRVKEAEALGLKRLGELEKDPAKLPEYLQTVASVCGLDVAMNRPAEARKLLETGLKALEGAKRDGMEVALDLAQAQLEEVQSALATDQGDHERALELGKSALDRLQKHLTANDVAVIDQLIEVEEMKIHAAGAAAIANALPFFQAQIRAYTRVLGTADCAPVADVYMARGYYYLNNMQDPTAAEKDFKMSLTIRQKVYGENSEVGSSLEGLAVIASLRGRDDEAMKLLGQARGMVVKVSGEDDPDIAGIDISTAAIQERKGNGEEAEKLLLKAIGVLGKYEQSRGDLADALDLLSDHYRTAGKDEKADDAHDRAEKIRAELKKRQEL